MMMENNDYLVTARAANDQIRAIAITSKNLVEEKRKLHNLSPIAGAAIGRLMSAALMMADWLKNETDTLTIEIAGEGKLSHLTAVSNNKGEVRGYVSNPDVVLPPNASGHLNVGGAIGKGHMTIIRDLGLKTPYVSQLNLVSGEIAEDLTKYLLESDQIPSACALGVLVDTDLSIKAAGGFIVQLMPGAEDDLIDKLEDNIFMMDQLTTILDEDGLEEVIEQVLKDLDHRVVEEVPAGYRCSCSEDKVKAALAAVSKDDLNELIAEDKEVEVVCRFCGRKYCFDAASLLKEKL
jgi:molecular chaperone Hsp33